MGRKLSYCKDDALAKAAKMFCSRGYEKTCMRDVAEQVNVPVASLYHTFGDKNALLAASLESYFEHNVQPMLDTASTAPHPLNALDDFFAKMIEHCAEATTRDGCIMIHAASELEDEVPDVAKVAKQMMSRMRDQFAAIITRGQDMGEITQGQPSEFLSAHLMANVIAIKTWLRMGASIENLQSYAKQALRILKA